MRRNIVFALFLTFFAGQLLLAQNMRPGGMMGPRKLTVDQRLKNLDDAVGLTAEQKKEIRKIFQNADNRMKKIYEENKGNRQAMRAAALDQREQTSRQIMNLLSDTQKEKYKKYLKTSPVQRNTQDRPFGGRGRRGGMQF